MNTRTVYLERHGALAAMNISSQGRDSRLYLIDVETLESRVYAVPEGQWGPYGLAQGVDGRLYIGFFGGRIYAFDPEKPGFHLLADPFAGCEPQRLTWGGAATSGGKIFMGVYPTGEFTEYDLASGSWRVIAPLPAETRGVYANQFVEMADGRVLVNLYGALGALLVYNPASGEIEARRELADATEQPVARSLVLLDEARVLCSTESALKVFNVQTLEWEADFASAPESVMDITSCPAGFFGTGATTGTLYRLTRAGCKPVDAGLHPGNRASGGVHQIGAETLIVLGDNGQVARFSLERGPLASAQLDNSSTMGMKIHMLHRISGTNRVVGSHFISSQMFRLDMESGAHESSLHKVVKKTGQITCATHLDGVVYAGVYGGAILLAYQPEEPFVYGENPRVFCTVGSRQNRPIGLCHDGRFLYMATRAFYGHLGGAIAVIDPRTGACEAYRHFVPGQNPVSFFRHGELLVGTTEIRGDQGSCLPEAAHAVAFAWSTTRRELVHTCAPWEAESLSALGLSPAGRLLGFEPGRYFLYDVVAQKCHVREWAFGVPGSGLFLDERRFLALLPEGGALLLDPATGETTWVDREIQNVRLVEEWAPGEFLAVWEDATVARVLFDDH